MPANRANASLLSLGQVISVLQRHYGKPKPPAVTEPFQIILFENVTYLVSDEQRWRIWLTLKRDIGVTPQAILTHAPAKIAAVIRDGGMQPARRAQKLIDAAEIAMQICNGSLASTLKSLPLNNARRLLKRFPGMGEPGVDKVLMLTGVLPILALDSNGLRVLQRLGYAVPSKNYAADYRSMRKAVADQLPKPPNYRWLVIARELLREHGQTLCRRNDPECDLCPLRKDCAFARRIKLA